MASNATMRPDALAKELGISGKVLRAYLRKEFTRSADVKGQAWVVTPAAAKAARAKFAKNKA